VPPYVFGSASVTDRCRTGPSSAPRDHRGRFALHDPTHQANGTLIKDRLFLFTSYETNIQDRQNTVTFGAIPANLPASVTQEFQAAAGTFTSSFRSHLLFTKLTLAHSERTTYELSYSFRKETDIRSFGGQPVSAQQKMLATD